MVAPAIARSGGFGSKATRRSDPVAGDAGKRALDIAGALALVLALSPLLLLLVVMLRVTTGSVLYRHPRVGRRGRTFDCLKLRTMHVDGDRILQDLLRDDPAARQEWLINRKLRNDPRVTPLGRFLRSTSLDELPQLINVLRGDMSLVGPRPVVASELEEHYGAEGTDIYCSVRPGLTGLWQISGRSDTSYRQRIDLDARYVRERSLALDVKILLRTPVAVLRRDGAR
jgi:lipopolysaccharide/colanic/teichoic acid biosynthesis glycosyltransferase